MTHSEIKAAILADQELSALLPDYGAVAAALSQSHTVLQERMIGIGTVLKYLGPEAGGALLDQMQELTATNTTVKWGWYLLERELLDVGLESTRAMLDQLLPAEAAAALKALAETQVASAVTWQQVRDTMEGM